MKKLLILSLALLMMLVSAACGDNDDARTASVENSESEAVSVIGDEGDTTSATSETGTTIDPSRSSQAPVSDANDPISTTAEPTAAVSNTTVSNTTVGKGKPTTSSTTAKPSTTAKTTTSSTTAKPTTAAKTTTSSTTAKPTTAVIPNVYLNNNNNYITEGEMSINPRYVYWRGGNLVAECYVINGTANTVTRLRVNELTIRDSSRVIASADFGEVSISAIGPNQHQLVTFTFGTNDVYIPNATLKVLNWYFDLMYM